MYLSEDDVAVIYARACVAWYGQRARHVVRKQIKVLERAGDRTGVVAWSQLADQLSRIARTDPDRGKNGKLY